MRSTAIAALLPASAALKLRTSDNRKIAQKLGGSLINAVEAMQGTGFQNEGDPLQDIQKYVMEELSAHQAVIRNPVVEEVATRANSVAARTVMVGMDACARDWSAPCPDGWAHGPGNGVCTAPASYGGGCAVMQQLTEASAAEKSKVAETCQAPWPCSGGSDCPNGRDYDACPSGWTTSGGWCQSDEESRCLQKMRPFDLSIAQKQEMTSLCGVTWPCRNACPINYWAECPEEWQKFGDLCLAPSTYPGPCSSSVGTTAMNMTQKRAFASVCGAPFPCVAEGATLKADVGDNQRHKLPDGPVGEAAQKENQEVTEPIPELRKVFGVQSGPLRMEPLQ